MQVLISMSLVTNCALACILTLAVRRLRTYDGILREFSAAADSENTVVRAWLIDNARARWAAIQRETR